MDREINPGNPVVYTNQKQHISFIDRVLLCDEKNKWKKGQIITEERSPCPLRSAKFNSDKVDGEGEHPLRPTFFKIH
jgi:hypothetical protein